eukprot:Gregarina_sp_Pseudo_9__1083@NODE_1705_length_1382_cov_22_918838_g1580_i0_p2_GENE_NODE_1705_length_1382_cov_22_918838_g1580_i0NODE_1705_length_1382_cov_22_918838_g1580_i0_p2_ORF_typecomplete_len111_score6_02_NODE_1705_length_1382_cov_22_918838_g1580_i08611193
MLENSSITSRLSNSCAVTGSDHVPQSYFNKMFWILQKCGCGYKAAVDAVEAEYFISHGIPGLRITEDNFPVTEVRGSTRLEEDFWKERKHYKGFTRARYVGEMFRKLSRV